MRTVALETVQRAIEQRQHTTAQRWVRMGWGEKGRRERRGKGERKGREGKGERAGREREGSEEWARGEERREG